MAQALYQIERFASSVFGAFALKDGQAWRLADFDSRERAAAFVTAQNERAEEVAWEVRLVDRRGPTQEELDGTYAKISPNRRIERPDAVWVYGTCPCCGSDTLVNAYHVGGRGYVRVIECWEALGQFPTCDFREAAPALG